MSVYVYLSGSNLANQRWTANVSIATRASIRGLAIGAGARTHPPAGAFLNSLDQSHHRPGEPRNPMSFRPTLESLEERTLLTHGKGIDHSLLTGEIEGEGQALLVHASVKLVIN